MKPVSALLAKRSLPVCSVKPDDTVFHALQVLAQHEVGALVVMEGDRLVGVISERDYTRKVALQNKSSKDTLVSRVSSVDSPNAAIPVIARPRISACTSCVPS
jgi:CBS domain-containing protein